MKTSVAKPLLRAATAHTVIPSNSNKSYQTVPLLRSSSSSRPHYEGLVHSSTSTTSSLVPRNNNNNMSFLRRTFSSHSYPHPSKFSRSLIPLGTIALIGGAMLLWSNSTAEAFSIPFFNKQSAAARMKERLDKHGFTEKAMSPDGNCQMRALSDQILGDDKFHKEVRLKLLDWLNKNEKFAVDAEGGATLGDFIDKDQFPRWSSYITYMSQNGAWGDHLTLLAAAEAYGVTITILSNVDDGGTDQYITKISPRSTKSTKDIYLSHWHEAHYNSLYKQAVQQEQQQQQQAA